MLKVKTKKRERKDKQEALEELSKNSTTRFNAEIDASLHKKIKLYSVTSKKTMKEIAEKAFNEYLSKYSNTH